jgi:hypothetical protein
MGSNKQSLIQDTSSINNGDIIFNSKIGFNYIHRIASSNPHVFDFKRVGYELAEKGYIIENVAFGNKYIQYK